MSLATAVKSINLRSAFKGADGVAYSLIHLLCKRFLEAFTFSTKLQAYQVESFAVDTLEAFEYESLDDVVLFFKMGRTGKFGTAKKGIDSNLVFGEWLPQYLELKATEREKIKQAEKIAKTTTQVTTEQLNKTYAVAEKKKRARETRDFIDKITKYMDRQMLEDTIIDWQKRVDRKHLVPLLKRKRLTIK